ncbi:hypothetical protein HY772_01060 [Candidatus Woesearchaeota archaeon]|nr:hypothetical protein [Candidatus Woesearchaeota archaeon]
MVRSILHYLKESNWIMIVSLITSVYAWCSIGFASALALDSEDNETAAVRMAIPMIAAEETSVDTAIVATNSSQTIVIQNESQNASNNFTANTTQALCDMSIAIQADQAVLSVNESLRYKFLVSRRNGANDSNDQYAAEFIIEYGIQYANGTSVQAPANRTNVNSEVFVPAGITNSTAIVIMARVIPSCIDVNATDNEANLSVLILSRYENITNTTNMLTPDANDSRITRTGTHTVTRTGNELPLESYIVVLNATTMFASGSDAAIAMELYRGKTRKRTVYAWIEFEGEKVSSVARTAVDAQFTIKNVLMVMRMKQECFKEGDQGAIRVTGLDKNVTVPVTFGYGGEKCLSAQEGNQRQRNSVEKDTKEVSQAQHEQDPTASIDKKLNQYKISYNIISYPNEVEYNKSFDVRALVQNPSQQDLQMTAWAKIASSSRSHDQSENVSLIVASGANVTFDLKLVARNDAPNQTVRVFFLRSDRKRPVILAAPIQVVSKLKETSSKIQERQRLASASQQQSATSSYDTYNRNAPDQHERDAENRGATVYESSTAKSRHLIVYFLFGTFLVLFGMVALKRM